MEKGKKNLGINCNERVGARRCIKEEPTFKETLQMCNSLGSNTRIEEKKDYPYSMQEDP